MTTVSIPAAAVSAAHPVEAESPQFNVALHVLRRAMSAGYTLTVLCEGEVDYCGTSARAAWNAILDCSEEMVVSFTDYRGVPLGWILTSAHGLEPDETVIDCSGSGPIAVLVESAQSVADNI